MQSQMFDCMVIPILLYASEMYGYEKSYIIESLFLQFYKIIMSLKRAHLMLSYMVNWVVTLQIFDQITHDWFLGKISLW